jgi:hypothetical protein
MPSSVEEPDADDQPVTAPSKDRAVWGTTKYRAEDLEVNDVVRNRFGKWDVVEQVKHGADGHYVHVKMQLGGDMTVRTVHLVDVQTVKPS